MSRRKKSGFLTFLFSLLPGAGEMYLGFMKMGISLMGMFFLLIAIAAVLNMGPIMFIMPVVWFFSFFHVHNLAGLPDAEFLNVQDDYLFHTDAFFHANKNSTQKYSKVMAAILILIGALMLWNGFMDIFDRYFPDEMVRILRHIGYTIPQMFVGIAIIAGGFRLIKGKKKELEMKEEVTDGEDNGNQNT